jgi:c-di-GMP phosphodiesterase
MKLRLLPFLLLPLCAGLFMASAYFALTAWMDAQKLKQMAEFNEIALRRSASAVEFALQTLDEVAKDGPLSCEPAELQRVRLHVYQRGSVKDIRAVRHDGSVLCSAYSETLEFDQAWATRDDMLALRDAADTHLFRVNQFSSVALGVMKDIDAQNGIAAIVGINAYLLDILPTELHDHSEITLELDNAEVITRQSHSGGEPEHDNQHASFTHSSDRFPLRTVIRVERDAFQRWNSAPTWPVLTIAGMLGLVFGLLLAQLIRRDEPMAEIERALAASEFVPYLQPIFNLNTGAIVGCEALARWQRPDGSVLPPARFIARIENSGLIARFTWQIMKATLTSLQPLMKQDKHFKVSFNVDPLHFLTDSFVDDLRRIVTDASVASRQVVLEMTERHEFPDLAAAAHTIERLRDYGFRIALDDVGIGHSGLQHIQGLGVQTLKVDKFFVDSIDRDTTATVVVGMLVRLARELNMTLVAEGIETEAQMAALIACGVEEGQGYLVSPPLAVPAFLVFVAQYAADRAQAAADGLRVA